ncbi:MAG: molybdopterin-guanine dinucleotide biosynthesis protein A [Candidatus Syntrophonatronum acetioxidans]|uniref:Molybdopterin-guanine dinucleotide biosynthesis protein A n=1 Tax=Candidatus Syntrophonatronum acetioxidans TaxID=1795816 RepID=A0A424YCM9_9FIRM|nr:MAG: molybdopterin-guanine dinucleotide biosynthesis protein A [Candidatus Syntrophonatronum acetioxidans]
MNAVVLAGSKGTSPLAEAFGETNKAFITLQGKPMINYVLEVLESLEEIEEVVVVGPLQELQEIEEKPSLKFVPEKGDIIDNVLQGVAGLSLGKPVILLTSDIPLITREALRDFIKRSQDLEADFCYPILRKKNCEEKYPGGVRTYARLKEGSFTGGNVFFIRPQVVESTAHKAGEFIELRKKPHLLALKLGIIFILKFIFKRLTVKEVEEKVSRLFGVKARAVITSYPEIGMDVDKVEDLKLVEGALSNK